MRYNPWQSNPPTPPPETPATPAPRRKPAARPGPAAPPPPPPPPSPSPAQQIIQRAGPHPLLVVLRLAPASYMAAATPPLPGVPSGEWTARFRQWIERHPEAPRDLYAAWARFVESNDQAPRTKDQTSEAPVATSTPPAPAPDPAPAPTAATPPTAEAPSFAELRREIERQAIADFRRGGRSAVLPSASEIEARVQQAAAQAPATPPPPSSFQIPPCPEDGDDPETEPPTTPPPETPATIPPATLVIPRRRFTFPQQL